MFDSLLAEARAIRLNQRPGRRFHTLEVVAEATQLARTLHLGEEDFRSLRNEAASCLALADLCVKHDWEGWPAGSVQIAFDGLLERYARVDRQRAVSVRRVADDFEICSIPGIGPGCPTRRAATTSRSSRCCPKPSTCRSTQEGRY